ncbi:hypothetical protein EDB81DRAFT_928660 [Dactylonectria macrodidyma]|uniref:RBR-type E3 ubiquitin transferase n=1 Tax=Dactylonectria macrodidyma TaxID=307937 RepID=A0A9P9F9U0_9HYPO|nr:hypothetical protein EDB81DRAFT_928660 [Dactylonectria macrodidyma]
MGDRPGGPLGLIHPELERLLRELDLYPRGDVGEHAVSEAIALAISLADGDRQLDIVSRLMSDQEIAAQGLQHPDVLNINLHIPLTAQERVEALRQSPTLDGQPEAPAQGVGDCIICLEPGTIALPVCGCIFCLPCLRATIRNGLRSEHNFPPRCCDAMSEAGIRAANRPALVHLHRQLAAEVAAPAQGRLYCHSGECATYIPRENRGECPSCGLRTCERCRGPAHGNGPCRAARNNNERGEELEDVWATMQENGAVNCPRCGRMVSLMDGCNHITCSCRAEFCYLCGAIWGRCFCEQYGSHHMRLPIAERPGLKPERWVPRQVPNEARPNESNNRPRTILQLRPWPGERPLSWNVPRRRVLEAGVFRPRTPEGRGQVAMPAPRNENGWGRDEIDLGRLQNEPRPPFPLRPAFRPAAQEPRRLEPVEARRDRLRGRDNPGVVRRALPGNPAPVRRFDNIAIADHRMPQGFDRMAQEAGRANDAGMHVPRPTDRRWQGGVEQYIDQLAEDAMRARETEAERLRAGQAEMVRRGREEHLQIIDQGARVMRLFHELGGGFRAPEGEGPGFAQIRRDAALLNGEQLQRLRLRIQYEAAQPLDPVTQHAALENEEMIEAFRFNVIARHGLPFRRRTPPLPDRGQANVAPPDNARRRQAYMREGNGNVGAAWEEELTLRPRGRSPARGVNGNNQAGHRPRVPEPERDYDSSSSSSSDSEEHRSRWQGRRGRRRHREGETFLRRFFHPFLDQTRRR